MMLIHPVSKDGKRIAIAQICWMPRQEGQDEGKSGFISHTKHTADATNMDLFHS